MKPTLPFTFATSLLLASTAGQSQSIANVTIDRLDRLRLCDLLISGCFNPCDHLTNCGLRLLQPDLVVADWYESGCAHSESSPVLAIVIRNEGTARAQASSLAVYLERSFYDYPEPYDYTFYTDVPALNPGESDYVFHRMPQWYDNDTHGIDIKVDYDEDNWESNEWNNDFWNTVTFGDC